MKNKKKRIICFDLDNVICFTDLKKNYKKSRPNPKAIKVINQLYSTGYIIKIFTARGMQKFKGNKLKVKKAYFAITYNQLKKWGVNYDELIMCKPSYDYFVDDKAYGFNQNWHKKILKILNQ